MNEIITPIQQQSNPQQSNQQQSNQQSNQQQSNQQQSNHQSQPPQQTVASIAIQIPPLQVDMNKVVRLLFDKIRRLEERLQLLEQPPQNRTPH